MSDIPIQKCPAVEYQESFVLFLFFLQLFLDMIPISGEDQEISKREMFENQGHEAPSRSRANP